MSASRENRWNAVLELHGLTRRFGEVVALDDVSFTVGEGQMFGFVGPNGAGKTTAMRIVLGVLRPDAGQVRWRSRPMDDAARRRTGYMPEERGLYPKMRVRAQLEYLAQLHGLDAAAARRSAGHWIERLGLTERASDRVEAALHDGDLDLVVVDGGQLLAESSPDDRLVAVVQAASRLSRARAALAEAKLSERQIQDALAPPPLPLRSLEASDPQRKANRAIAFPAVLLLYGQLIGYGIAVASGVIEEKATRVVEVLLSAIRPLQLMAGKVIGVGLVGLLQLLIVGGVGLGVAVAVDAVDLPPGAFATLGLVLAWFLLGYAFYSVLFAVAGAVVSRQEELQNTATPLNLVLFASFFAAISALRDPGGTIAKVASFLPPVAPLTMPVRVAGGEAAGWEIVVSVLLTLASIALLVPLSARLYAGAVLRTGARVKLRAAWTASRG